MKQEDYSPLISDTSKMYITASYPPVDRKIITAANRHTETNVIVVGARHFSTAMMGQIQSMNLPDISGGRSFWEQGFIDQWDNFLTRREAMKICLANNQPVDFEGCGGSREVLYSEGLH